MLKSPVSVNSNYKYLYCSLLLIIGVPVDLRLTNGPLPGLLKHADIHHPREHAIICWILFEKALALPYQYCYAVFFYEYMIAYLFIYGPSCYLKNEATSVVT